ncbi:MAG: hypothetical protein HY957_00815 [Nitrospirae bacterium]|nr:hypothetical protein [Nitrospirota bacterium]
MSNHTNFLAMISTEFHKYLMENEGFADKIPANTMIIFQIEGENDFNKWHEDTSLRNREADQPVVYVYVKKWRNHSSIEEVSLAGAAA